MWKSVFEIDKLFEKFKEYSNEVKYRNGIEKNKRTIQILSIILASSIFINIINLLLLIFVMKL